MLSARRPRPQPDPTPYRNPNPSPIALWARGQQGQSPGSTACLSGVFPKYPGGLKASFDQSERGVVRVHLGCVVPVHAISYAPYNQAPKRRASVTAVSQSRLSVSAFQSVRRTVPYPPGRKASITMCETPLSVFCNVVRRFPKTEIFVRVPAVWPSTLSAKAFALTASVQR